MTDAVRALSAIQTLWADNTTRAISEQDLRDGIYSAIGVVPAGAKTTSYTLTDDDEFFTADATGGAVVFTLPAASSTRAGKVFIIQKIDAGGNAVSFARAGSDTINSATSKSTTTQYNALMVIRASSSTWSCFTLTGS
jgi:hypothetical protein